MKKTVAAIIIGVTALLAFVTYGLYESRRYYGEAEPVADLSRRSIREDVDLSAGPVERVYELLRGTRLDVKLTGGAGLTLDVVDNEGNVLDLSAALKTSTRGVALRRFDVPSTGRFFVRFASNDGGAARLRTRVSAPRRWRGTTHVEPGAAEDVFVPALPAATIRANTCGTLIADRWAANQAAR